MIRLYGRDAESVAMGHAETHADMGDRGKSEKWQRIAAAIGTLRHIKEKGTAQTQDA